MHPEIDRLCFVCGRCVKEHRKVSLDPAHIFKFSSENNMLRSLAPRELRDLTEVETMFVKILITLKRSYTAKGFMKLSDGASVTIPNNLLILAETLPRLPHQVGMLILQNRNFRGDISRFCVRRKYIHIALLWLSENNPLYFNLPINLTALNQIPENGVSEDFITIIDTVDDHSLEVDLLSDDIDIVAGPVVNTFAMDEMLAPQEETTIDLGDMPSPVCQLSQVNFLSLSFPELFPYGCLHDSTSGARVKDVEFSEAIKHYLQLGFETPNSEIIFPFSSHPTFGFIALDIIERVRVRKQLKFVWAKSPLVMGLGIRRLNEILLNPADSIKFLNTLTVYLGNIRGSPSYWRNVSGILKSICENASPSCGVYFTISFPDFYINTIFDIVFRNTHSYDPCSRIIRQTETRTHPITLKEHLSDLAVRMRFLARHPVLSAQLFDFCLKKAVQEFLKDQLNTEYYFVRIEVQARGALHCHGLVALKDHPQTVELVRNYENSAKRMIELLWDSNNLPNLISPVDLNLFSLGLKSKLRLETLHDDLMTTIDCAPHFVFDILKEGHPSLSKFQNFDLYENSFKTYQAHKRCNPTYCKNANNPGRCRFGFPKKLVISTQLRYKKKSVGGHIYAEAELESARNCRFTNSHSPFLLSIVHGNIDVQIILHLKELVNYIAKYICKSENESTLLVDLINNFLARDPLTSPIATNAFLLIQ